LAARPDKAAGKPPQARRGRFRNYHPNDKREERGELFARANDAHAHHFAVARAAERLIAFAVMPSEGSV
jgi:hypothetical protein